MKKGQENMKFTPSTQIWNSYPDKECYEWKSRGKYCYEVAKKFEDQPKRKKK